MFINFLLLGFLGNLRVKISQLLGFFLLTLLIETPLVILLVTLPNLKMYAFEYALDSVQLAFILFQLIGAFFAARSAINCALRDFRESKCNHHREGVEFVNPAFLSDEK